MMFSTEWCVHVIGTVHDGHTHIRPPRVDVAKTMK
jgi:hypothetical protein